ncbi:hypothetical protein NQ176_g7643 [Zarea fungicola]|uniref:Uncharacterized protein n=1 Tax=Zarea fungicola TaxID=93591 RepID=A0ACC1MY01_9HYPO|nr:hypothetical protein NQ176_g7643 [Lecanicillium fungicola]
MVAKTILLTGGSGFIAAHILEQLLAKGHHRHHHCPAPKPVARPAPVKRPHYEDDSSSSSSERAPELHSSSKPVAKPANKPKNNTSPMKSSPLASSPPTNASDIESDHRPLAKKRKMAVDDKPGTTKRRAIDQVPQDIMNKATKFKAVYAKYESLHYQIAALEHPPEEKVANLIDMRYRLETMKREIYGGV